LPVFFNFRPLSQSSKNVKAKMSYGEGKEILQFNKTYKLTYKIIKLKIKTIYKNKIKKKLEEGKRILYIDTYQRKIQISKM